MSEISSSLGNRTGRMILFGIVLAFFAFRLPPMLFQPGRIDEECYAIPGLTILETGLPQLPHMPSRNPSSMFYRADEILFAEPPLFFYLQALAYSVLPVTYASARLVSILASIAVLCLVARLTVRWTGSLEAGLWSAGLLGFSRWFQYSTTLARPDMLCTLFGVAAVLMVERWIRTRQSRWLVLTGVLLGLGGLTLPLAIVMALLIAGWVFLESSGWQRLKNPAMIAVAASVVFSMWGLLIAMDPALFKIQFNNQFLELGSGKALHWLVRPLQSLWYHLRYLWLNIGSYQFILAAASTVACGYVGFIKREMNLIRLSCLTWASFVLLSLFVGCHHDVPGYWAFTGALAFVGIGWTIQSSRRYWTQRCGRYGGLLVSGALLAMIGLMIPGSGIRLFVEYVGHWGDENYNSTAFAKRLLREVPADARCLVDGEFVLDFLAAGRTTLATPATPIFFDASGQPYDWMIVSRSGQQKHVAAIMKGTLVEAKGIPEDEFACYAEIYRPNSTQSP